MKKVYIVCEVIDGEKSIGGVYSTRKQALIHAADIAEYSGYDSQGNGVWGDDEDNSIAVQEHDVF